MELSGLGDPPPLTVLGQTEATGLFYPLHEIFYGKVWAGERGGQLQSLRQRHRDARLELWRHGHAHRRSLGLVRIRHATT